MKIGKVGVVGAGMMGSEIALVFALSGAKVLLNDTAQANLERAMTRLEGALAKGVERGVYGATETETALANIETTTTLSAYGDRELVIEAVFEDRAVKAETFRKLDAVLPRPCLVASNTSTIPISVLAAAFAPERRSRFLGTHFFSPASRMKLVEVISGLETADETVARVMEALREAGKEPVRIKDVPGFAVNRLLHAFLIEAVRLVEEGVASPEDVDKCCRLGLGHPVGPFALMDIVKNSLTLQVQDILHDAYGARFLPRPLMRQMVEAGFDGRDAGRGWFDYGTRSSG